MEATLFTLLLLSLDSFVVGFGLASLKPAGRGWQDFRSDL